MYIYIYIYITNIYITNTISEYFFSGLQYVIVELQYKTIKSISYRRRFNY